jgi:hypothetical protein
MHIFLAAVKREVPAQFPWGSKWLKERTSCPTLNEKKKHFPISTEVPAAQGSNPKSMTIMSSRMPSKHYGRGLYIAI